MSVAVREPYIPSHTLGGGGGLSWHLSVTSSFLLLLMSLSNEDGPGYDAADKKTTKHDLAGGNKAFPEKRPQSSTKAFVVSVLRVSLVAFSAIAAFQQMVEGYFVVGEPILHNNSLV